MRRHGYKGAFELAATVDYLFGYDATAGVVADWMYEKLAESYVLDPENREFLADVQPVGAARHRRAAAGGRRPRAVGGARAGDPRRPAAGLPGDRGRPGGGVTPHGLRHRDRRREPRAPDPAGRRRDEPRRRVLHDRQGRGDGRPRRAARRAAGPPRHPPAPGGRPRRRCRATDRDPAAYVDTAVRRLAGAAARRSTRR